MNAVDVDTLYVPANVQPVTGKKIRVTALEQKMLDSVKLANSQTGFNFSVARSDEVRYARALFDLHVTSENVTKVIRRGLTVTEIELVLETFSTIVTPEVQAEVDIAGWNDLLEAMKAADIPLAA